MSIEQKIRNAVNEGKSVIEFEYSNTPVNKLIQEINYTLGKLGYNDRYNLSIRGKTVSITLQ